MVNLADPRNRYVYPTTPVKWIVAQRRQGGEWFIRYLGSGDRPTLDYVLDVTQIGDVEQSEFGVFRNQEDWWCYPPRAYYRGYELPLDLRAHFGGLINSLDSSWF